MTDQAAMEEWLAWRVICLELEERGIDVNEPKHEGLVRAMRYYGAAYRGLFPEGEHYPQHDNDQRYVQSRHGDLTRKSAGKPA